MKHKLNFLLMAMALVLMATSCETKTSSTPRAKHVILIGMDGWGSYSVEKAEMPNVKSMMKDGAYALTKRSVLPSSSAANWASMYMGAGPELHGYTTWGSKTPEIPSRVVTKTGMFPTVFHLLREAMPDAVMGCIHEWDGIRYLIDTTAFNWVHQTLVEDASTKIYETTRLAAEYIKQQKPTLLHVNYEHPDVTGHRIGHDTPEYYAKLKELDGCVGQIVEAVKQAGIFEETVFILTSDHGGINKGHGGKTIQEMQSPFILYGKGIQKGVEIHDSVMQFDCAPTIAEIFGVKAPQVWIGRPVMEAFVEK